MDTTTLILSAALVVALGILTYLAARISEAADTAADIRRRMDDINGGLG